MAQSDSLERDDCDLMIFKSSSTLLTGTVLIDEVSIKIENLPDPLVYKKSQIAYIHFKQKPYQPDDFMQIVDGSSVTGTIRNLDPIRFKMAGTGQELDVEKDKVLVLVLRCNVERAMAVS